MGTRGGRGGGGLVVKGHAGSGLRVKGGKRSATGSCRGGGGGRRDDEGGDGRDARPAV